jgi:hypothetical protein
MPDRICSRRAERHEPVARGCRGLQGVLIYLFNTDFYIIDSVEAARWLARVRHDLVKRLLWPARDRRDVGGTPAPGELRAALIDDEGAATTAAALWEALAAEAPAGAALEDFARALGGAVAAADAGDVAGVLALDPAFERLAQSLEGKS